jgi:hypothetical protein
MKQGMPDEGIPAAPRDYGKEVNNQLNRAYYYRN